MPAYTITIEQDGCRRSAAAGEEETLLSLLRGHGAAPHAPCGGNGTCRQCLVTVSGPCRGPDGSVRVYDGEALLACRFYPAGDLCVTVPSVGKARVLTDAGDIPPGGDGLGLAVDIGTTTVAAYLYDLASGRCLASVGEENAQRAYGADVISRIQYASSPEGLERLCRAVREQLLSLADTLSGSRRAIRSISVAGNTVMEHLFAGLSPESIGKAPFRPLSLFGEERDAAAFLPGFAPDCRLYLCPAVAGYVGGDITAGLLSSGAYAQEKTTLFLDIGTNGEMALGSREGWTCCAAAAGPAFEGAATACGSPARDGAISRVEKDLSLQVLGGGEPRSLCGSGMLDTVAVLLARGVVDESGRMEGARFFLSEKVYVSAGDIRAIQLAKAAIRGGVETLLESRGIGCGDVDQVLLAGGFGTYFRVESACAIGLLPPALLSKARPVGNAAGQGAALALTADGRRALSAIQGSCRYLELSSSPAFSGHYIDAMGFEEWEDVYGR